MPQRLTTAQARAAWVRQQRLDEPRDGVRRPLVDTVASIGWIALPFGTTAYLALLARHAIASRSDLDEAAGKRAELLVVPGPRGSSWLVPVADAPVARAFAMADHASREARIAAATTLSTRDLEVTRDSLRAALATPITLEQLRAKLPESALRPLGDVGRKAGLGTVAALVLRSLWVNGEVMRVADDGKLDAPVARWAIDPRPRTVPTAADAVNAIAGRWIAAHGPVTLKTFAAAFGIAAGRATAALKVVHAGTVEIEGSDETYLVAPGFAVSDDDSTAFPPRFLPVRDPLVDVQASALSASPAVRSTIVRPSGSVPAVLSRGELVGAWYFDEGTRAIAWRGPTTDTSADVTASLDLEAQRVGAFVARERIALTGHVATPARHRPGAVPAADLSIEF